MNIIEAILTVDRDPKKLASLAGVTVKKSQEEIANALQGSWRQELTNIGNDIHKFPTGKSFASWLRLVPNNKISGGYSLTPSFFPSYWHT